MISACGVCNALEYPNECWYWSKSLGVPRIPSKATLYLRRFSDSAESLATQLGQLEEEVRLALRGVHFDNVAVEFPSPYVPEVRPMGRDFRRSMRVVNAVHAPIVAVSLETFYSGIHETPKLRQAKKNGIHHFLGYEGQVLLTTDVRDELCDFLLGKPDYFVQTVNQLSPNYVTTLDAYTYFDLPTYISRINVGRVLKTLPILEDLRCKVVGLVLGSNSDEVLGFAQRLVQCGVKLLAFPSYELRRQKLDVLLRRRIVLLKKKMNLPVIALSCSPNPTKWDFSPDYYSGWSWFPFSRSDSTYLQSGSETLLRKIKRAKSAVFQTRLEDFGYRRSVA
jgi:hypothetical protein